MNQPTLDYWTGPAQPPGWRGMLIWPYVLGTASGVLGLLVLSLFSAAQNRILEFPYCCLLLLPTVVISALGSAMFLAASEIRIRLLGRKFHVRQQWRAWLAGLLLPAALLGAARLAVILRVRDRLSMAIILLIAVFFAYPFVAAVILIRPLHELTSIAPILPAPPSDPQIPTAQLAPPEHSVAENQTADRADFADQNNNKSA